MNFVSLLVGLGCPVEPGHHPLAQKLLWNNGGVNVRAAAVQDPLGPLGRKGKEVGCAALSQLLAVPGQNLLLLYWQRRGLAEPGQCGWY